MSVSSYADDLEIIPSVYFFNYEEFNTLGVSLDKEIGIVPGIKIKYLYQHNSLTVSPFFSLHDGSVDYIGSTQTGSSHNTKTNTNLFTAGVEFDFQLINNFNFIGGMQHTQWDRDILSTNGVLGLHELYTWTELSAGVSYQSDIFNNSYYSFSISALYILNPAMKIYLQSTDETLRLGEGPGIRFLVGKKWILQEDTIRLNLITEYWQFGRSNTVFTNDFFGSSVFITEPESKSLHTRIELVFGSVF